MAVVFAFETDSPKRGKPPSGSCMPLRAERAFVKESFTAPRPWKGASAAIAIAVTSGSDVVPLLANPPSESWLDTRLSSSSSTVISADAGASYEPEAYAQSRAILLFT